MATNPLEQEIEDALALVRSLIDAYSGWNLLRKNGSVMNVMYSFIYEFANFRVETAETCALLIEHNRIADALGLQRSLLENYLLLQLLCRGNRFFQFSAPLKGGDASAAKQIADEQARLEVLHAQGEALHCLRIEAYPRAGSTRLMWVWEGLHGEDDPDFIVPYYYFQFQRFSPESLRLNEANYARDLPPQYVPSEEVKAVMQKHKAELKETYDHYLSYQSLLTCLQINELIDQEQVHRIQAHYTFLGKFLHPTDGAARQLHTSSNHQDNRTGPGLTQPYDRHAVLLAALYDVWLLASVLSAVSSLAESATKEIYTDPGTGPMRAFIEQVRNRFSYFWFIDNDAPLLDRFNYAGVMMSEAERAQYPNWTEIPTDDIKFDMDVYQHLKETFQQGHRYGVGTYYPPYGGTPNADVSQ